MTRDVTKKSHLSQLLHRSISDVVLTSRVDIPALPTRLLADWEREMSLQLDLQAGDVEALPLARARMRWPDYSVCVQAAVAWDRYLREQVAA